MNVESRGTIAGARVGHQRALRPPSVIFVVLMVGSGAVWLPDVLPAPEEVQPAWPTAVDGENQFVGETGPSGGWIAARLDIAEGFPAHRFLGLLLDVDYHGAPDTAPHWLIYTTQLEMEKSGNWSPPAIWQHYDLAQYLPRHLSWRFQIDSDDGALGFMLLSDLHLLVNITFVFEGQAETGPFPAVSGHGLRFISRGSGPFPPEGPFVLSNGSWVHESPGLEGFTIGAKLSTPIWQTWFSYRFRYSDGTVEEPGTFPGGRLVPRVIFGDDRLPPYYWWPGSPRTLSSCQPAGVASHEVTGANIVGSMQMYYYRIEGDPLRWLGVENSCPHAMIDEAGSGDNP